MHFTYTAPLDDDCHFPVVAEWTIHYFAKIEWHLYSWSVYVRINITKIELESVTVELMKGEKCRVIAQTENKKMDDFEAELRKRLDMDLLYELAFADYQKFPDAGRDVA